MARTGGVPAGWGRVRLVKHRTAWKSRNSPGFPGRCRAAAVTGSRGERVKPLCFTGSRTNPHRPGAGSVRIVKKVLWGIHFFLVN
jgi:hypothetical protein